MQRTRFLTETRILAGNTSSATNYPSFTCSEFRFSEISGFKPLFIFSIVLLQRNLKILTIHKKYIHFVAHFRGRRGRITIGFDTSFCANVTVEGGVDAIGAGADVGIWAKDDDHVEFSLGANITI